MRTLLAALLFSLCASTLPAAPKLAIYFIDVEGGQATLFAPPGGDSMLVDAGWAGFNHRDADRILAAAKSAGVKKIDYLVITHFHSDHVGGVYQLAQRMPILHFVDHGSNTEPGQDAAVLFNEYRDVRSKGEHLLAKPGDRIPVKGLDVRVLASGGQVIASPAPEDAMGKGEPNPACAYRPMAPDLPENEQSIALSISFGDFRMVDMGDLTENHEYELVCPVNKIGVVDLFLATHHGGKNANSLPFVHAIAPRVAIVDNGPHKGGDPGAWQTIHDTRGLLDIWQLHYAIDSDKRHNAPDAFIANLDAACEGKWIKVTANRDGAFTVYNSRNKFQKTYTKR